jgi:hypothetical protein
VVTLDKDEFGQLTHDAARKFLRFVWFPATVDMTIDDFKRSLTVVADAALAHSVESILVDVRDFSSMSAMEDARFVMEAWRGRNIVPKYNKVFKRLAWLADDQLPKLPGGGYVYSYEGETFQNRWFRDEAAALLWATL